jgi:hypothetical protein
MNKKLINVCTCVYVCVCMYVRNVCMYIYYRFMYMHVCACIYVYTVIPFYLRDSVCEFNNPRFEKKKLNKK